MRTRWMGRMASLGLACLCAFVCSFGTFEAHAQDLVADVAEGELGSIIVTSNVAGAEVFIDGKLVGLSVESEGSAEPIQLPRGDYMVSVLKDGFNKDGAVKVSIEAGKQQRVHMNLTKTIRRHKIDNSTNDALKIAGWTTLGVGVATFVAAGVVMGLHYDLMKSDAVSRELHGEWHWVVDSGIFEGKKSDDADALEQRLKRTNYVLWPVGGVLATGGLIMTCLGYLYDFGSDGALSGVPVVNVAVMPEYQGVSLGWKF